FFRESHLRRRSISPRAGSTGGWAHGKSSTIRHSQWETSPSHVEPDKEHVTVLHDVLLSFEPKLVCLLCTGEIPGRQDVLPRRHLGSDESLGEVRMNLPGGADCRGASADAPRLAFILSDREKAHQVQRPVYVAEEAVLCRLLQTEIAQEILLVLRGKLRNLHLHVAPDREGVDPRCGGFRQEVRVFGGHFSRVDHEKHRLRGKKP